MEGWFCDLKFANAYTPQISTFTFTQKGSTTCLAVASSQIWERFRYEIEGHFLQQETTITDIFTLSRLYMAIWACLYMSSPYHYLAVCLLHKSFLGLWIKQIEPRQCQQFVLAIHITEKKLLFLCFCTPYMSISTISCR